MKKLIAKMLAALGLLLGATSQSKADDRLNGTWKSNKELTLATFGDIVQKVDCDDVQKAKEQFLSVFGLMTVTYTKDVVSMHMPAIGKLPASDQRSKYTITKSTKDTVTIHYDEPIEGARDQNFVIHFESPDRYWVKLEVPFEGIDTSGWKEYFDRMPVK